MSSTVRRQGTAGFSLLEVLVALLIIALLVAALVPVVVPQLRKADPTRIGDDLNAIRTGVQLFSLDVRPRFPRAVEQLVNAIATTEQDINGAVYSTSNQNQWDGPYIDWQFPLEGATIATGFDAAIKDTLRGFNSDANNVVATGSIVNGHFLAVLLTGIDSAQFELANDVVDGTSETDSVQSMTRGRLRFRDATTDTTFYLVVPFKN